MKRKGKYEKKYPKMVTLILTLFLAYIIFHERNNLAFLSTLNDLGTGGVFIAGLLFSYGFTSGPATAIFLTLGKQHNTIITALIGGAGALIADITIYTLIRTTMVDEIERIEREPIFKKVKSILPRTIRRYILPILGGFIIASPLPDEMGIALLASIKKINPVLFTIISYTFITIGI